MDRYYTGRKGFSLIEMMIAMSVGLIVLGGAVQIYSSSVNATWTVSQRALLQQDARAAYNLLAQDIGMAGAGIPTGGVPLASGTATPPKYGCDVASGTCHLGSANSFSYGFPPQSGSPSINQLYGVVPGCTQGPTINAAAGATDTITVAYTDANFPLSNYQVEFMDANGNGVQFIRTNATDTAVNNPGVGLKKGDLVLFQYLTTYAAVEVTDDLGSGPSPYVVPFASGDLLLMNQNAATSGGLKQLIAACVAKNVCTVATPPPAPPDKNARAVTATRLYIITYYIDKTSGTPRLMRLANGLQPVPVADNVQDLQFTYAAYDDVTGVLQGAPSCNAGGVSPNLIRNINITHLSIRSQGRNPRGYQGIDMQGTISARNLSFEERYGAQ